MWNLSQIFIARLISGFCRISSVCRSVRCKNAKFEPNFHRECIFWILPDFGGKNVKFEPNFHRQWNFWILPDFKCLQLREVQEYEIRAEFSSRVHFFDFAEFWGQTCEIWAKFSSAVEFLDFAGFQVFAFPEGARMWKCSRIFIARAFSGFYPNLGAKIWNLRQIFIGSGISGFWGISRINSSGRCKNAKFEPNFHRKCIFWILPNFGGNNVKFVPDFHRQWNFWILPDFKCFTRPGFARKWNSIRILIARAFSLLCPILVAKMWNLCQIFIGSGISGFCRISSVYSSGRCKNAKFEPNFQRKCIFWILPDFGCKTVKFETNFHRQWNFWILPDFKCLQVRKVQECENVAEFSLREQFLDFTRLCG